jgi:hypothetical protein
MPDDSVIDKPTTVRKYYANKSLRAFIISLSLTYFNKLDQKDKLDKVKQLVDDNSTNSNMRDLNFDAMRDFRKFEENDFSQRF